MGRGVLGEEVLECIGRKDLWVGQGGQWECVRQRRFVQMASDKEVALSHSTTGAHMTIVGEVNRSVDSIACVDEEDAMLVRTERCVAKKF
jgi:hypothetical protein